MKAGRVHASFPKRGAAVAAAPSAGSLSPCQLRIARLIADYCATNGVNPTLEEIARAVGRNKVSVLGHVQNLRKLGVLKPATRYRLRSIELADGVVLPKPRGPSQAEWLALASEAIAWLEDGTRHRGPLVEKLKAAIDRCSK